MKEDFLYYLSFSHFLGIGPIKFKSLINYYGSAKKAYFGNRSELEKIIGLELASKFIDFRHIFNPAKKMEEIKSKGITVISIGDNKYPENLKNISDPPICIYIKGSVKSLLNSLNLAIVGSRTPSLYGIEVTKKFTRELAGKGFTIISGLAYGIDTVVHKICLENKGITIAVLGCGVDVVYPEKNRELYENIINSRGAIISEFPPGQTVTKGLFVARNRIISGLVKGVLVIEGAKHSGSLITARYAAMQGKDVFAVPGNITSLMSEGPNILLKQGAKLVTSINDVVEEFNLD